MKILQLVIVFVMAALFIKDGFVVPLRLRKQGKVPPRHQLALVLIEIVFLSFFLVLFSRLR